MFADEAARLLDRLGIATAAAYGIGHGASVALALARAGRVEGLALQGVLLPDADQRADLAAYSAPPIEIAADGGHWYRTWLMLRDSCVYWPWYDRRLSAVRRVDTDLSARSLHRWTMDVMRARESYGHLIAAALAHDGAAALSHLSTPPVLVRDPRTPLDRFAPAAMALCPAASMIAADAPGFADTLAMLFPHTTGTSRVF